MAPPQTAGPEAHRLSVMSGTGSASVSPTIGKVVTCSHMLLLAARRASAAGWQLPASPAVVRSGPKFSPSNVTHAAPVEASISPGETGKMRWQVAEVRDCQPYNSPWRSSQQQQHGGSGLACCGNPSVSALTVCSGIERSTRPVSVEDAERGPEKERVQSRTRPRKAQRNKRASWRARAGPASMCVIRALRWIRQTAGWHGRFARGHLEPAHNQQPSAQRPAHT